MTTLTTKLYSLLTVARAAKMALMAVALLTAACGEPAAMDMAQQAEVLDVPEAIVYVEEIRFGDEVYADAEPVQTEPVMVCERTDEGSSCVLKNIATDGTNS